MLEIICIAGLALGSLYLLVYSPSLMALLGSLITMIAAVFVAENKKDSKIIPRGKAVLVTGCDTGFGNALARYLDSIGMIVFAGCLHGEGDGAKGLRDECSDRVHVLQMDVTADDQILKAKAYVLEHLPREGLYGVVNNAGLNFNGDIELTTMAQYKKVIDINLLGVVRVTKAFLPQLRKSKGRILNVTSVKGRISHSFNSAYGMAKFAGETMSDMLRLEMKKWGVDVIIIEPGNFGGATKCYEPERSKQDLNEMWEEMDEEAKEDYGKDYVDYGLKALDDAAPTSCFNIQLVIEGMAEALLALKPKPRYLIAGGSGRFDAYKWFILASPFVPTCLMDRLVLWYFSSGFPLPRALQLKDKNS